MYKHKIVTVEMPIRSLAMLASEVAAQRLNLPFRPWVNFFTEDPNGSFGRTQRVSGFIDFYTSETDLDLFIRAERSPEKTVKTIFHESFHAATSHLHDIDPERPRVPLAIEELRADRFAFENAPRGDYESVVKTLTRQLKPVSAAEVKLREQARAARGSLQRMLAKRRQWSIEQGLERARAAAREAADPYVKIVLKYPDGRQEVRILPKWNPETERA
jgi:hypothetical protein